MAEPRHDAWEDLADDIRRDEQTLREAGLDAPARSSVPRVVHPWPEAEPERVGKGLATGSLIAAAFYALVALALGVIVAWVS